MQETHQFIPTKHGKLFCSTFEPDQASESGAPLWAFIHPLFEEKKNCHRFLVQAARALAAKGNKVLMVDLPGWGDSEGDLMQYGFSTWPSALHQVIEDVIRATPAHSINIFSMRFSCHLMQMQPLSQLIDHQTMGHVVWLDPVFDGEHYWQELWRQKQIRQMMTKGDATNKSLETSLSDDATIDMDGFAVSSQLIKDMQASKLTLTNGQTHWLQLSPNERLTPVQKKFVAQYNSKVTPHFFHLPAFWRGIDNIDAQAIVDYLVHLGPVDSR